MSCTKEIPKRESKGDSEKMKKFLSIALCAVMVLGILAGCGQKGNDTPKNNDNSTALSGSVSTNGSTSMDKVIGVPIGLMTAIFLSSWPRPRWPP